MSVPCYRIVTVPESRRINDPPPSLDLDAEADLVSLRPAPGAVFLRLRQRLGDGSERCLFAELTPGEAVTLRRELDRCIGLACLTAYD